MSDGFLGRWSRRKQGAREGSPLEDKPENVDPASRALASPTAQPPSSAGAAVPASAAPRAELPAVPEPPPTLDEVRALTPESDFRRFVTRDVDPQVRNAAVKKLFADPHFNVMDGLDIYIDDYSKPDPLPLAMLRKMASAQFLNLVAPEETAPTPQAHDDQATPSAPVTADAASTPPHPTDPHAGLPQASQAQASAIQKKAAGPQPTTEDYDDTDLRLQQDHAAGAQGSGSGAE